MQLNNINIFDDLYSFNAVMQLVSRQLKISRHHLFAESEVQKFKNCYISFIADDAICLADCCVLK